MGANGPYCQIDVSGTIANGPNNASVNIHLEGEACQNAITAASKPAKPAKPGHTDPNTTCNLTVNGSIADGTGNTANIQATTTGATCQSAFQQIMRPGM